MPHGLFPFLPKAGKNKKKTFRLYPVRRVFHFSFALPEGGLGFIGLIRRDKVDANPFSAIAHGLSYSYQFLKNLR